MTSVDQLDLAELETRNRNAGNDAMNKGKISDYRAPGGSSASRNKAALPKDVQTQLGRKLRAVYGELVEQPVPDRFLALLNDLSKQEAEDAGSDVEAQRRSREQNCGPGQEP